MTRSFSSLCITNAICLTSFWIFIGLAMFATKMQEDQDFFDVHLKIEKDDIHLTIEDFFFGSWRNHLPYLRLTTISKSLIRLGIVLDNAVCFIEFMVVWLKVQAPPSSFYWLTAIRYLVYNIMSIYCWYSLGSTWVVMAINLSIWTLSRIIQAVNMCSMNKELSDKVDGINNPVAHAVGPTGNMAMAGA